MMNKKLPNIIFLRISMHVDNRTIIIESKIFNKIMIVIFQNKNDIELIEQKQ